MSTNQTLQKYWGRELEREEVSPYVNPTQCGYTAVYKAADVDVALTEIQQDRDNAIASFNDAIERECELMNKLAALTKTHEAGRQAGLYDIEEQWKEEYEKVLSEQDAKISYMEVNKDTHGWNLHQGLRFGAIEMDLAFGRILNRFRDHAKEGAAS